MKDDISGSITDPAKEVRITFHASQATKLSATLTDDPRARSLFGALGAAGLSLTLCDDAGTDLGVAGTKHDLSKPPIVRWRAFPLPSTGDFTLIVRATGTGTWRLKLAGVLASTRADETTVALAKDATDELAFEGLAGGKASWTLSRSGAGSKFKGEAVTIRQPDGSDLADVEQDPSGSVTLLQDGTHTFVYRNAGTAAGDGRAVVTVKPPRVVKRTVHVRPAGAVLVPVVAKIDPPRAFHKEDALAVTIRGRDFESGCDVRLVRAGRPDIVGSAVTVRSEAEITCVFDLDTADTDPDSRTSVGTWTVGVWNAPEYTTPDDPSTLVKDSLTRSLAKKFACLSASSITLPAGVVKATEVWYVEFNDDFQDDLDAMGLGSTDPTTRARCRSVVEAYTILFLRDLFLANETFGTLKKNTSVPVSFIVGKPARVAGDPGVDYNRIEVGGTWQAGDPQDPAEPLPWGASGLPGSEIDFENTKREDLGVLDASSVRIGLGARTGVLDPSNAFAASGWVVATQPLRDARLVAGDAGYFTTSFIPANQTQADRYAAIANQVTRASREIAAIVAHHVGKAMGLSDGASSGPMSNPTTAGDLWATQTSAKYANQEVSYLRDHAVPHQLPGTSRQLQIVYLPLLTQQAAQLADCVTPMAYSAKFKFVGGRPNAVPADYRVQYVAGGVFPPSQLTLSFDSISGTVPVSPDGNASNFSCYAAVFRIVLTDTVRGGQRFFRWRLDTYPDVNHPNFPQVLRQQAINCIATLPPK